MKMKMSILYEEMESKNIKIQPTKMCVHKKGSPLLNEREKERESKTKEFTKFIVAVCQRGDLGFGPVQSMNLLIMLILNLQRRLSDWLTFLRG